MTLALLDNLRFISKIRAAGGEIYQVGGAVRDELLCRPVKDVDLVVTHLTIDALITLLKGCGRTNLVGKSFGVIKFQPQEAPKLELDIALPRTEISTGPGHKDFSVSFDPQLPIQADLKRRDFTINAMAKDVTTGQIIDPYGGLKDLKNGLIKTVFSDSFLEDPLRLLRAVQFAARFGFSIAPETFAQMSEHAPLILSVARERIVEEVKKLFRAQKPSVGFDLMRDTGLLKYVFPEVFRMIGVTQPQKNNEDVYTHTMKVLDAARAAEELEKPGDLNIMFSALFHDAGKPKTRRETPDDPHRVTFYNHQHASKHIARRWLKDHKATVIGVDTEKVCHLVEHHMFETKAFNNDKAIRRFINKVGKENIFDLLDLRLADKKGGRFPKKVYGIMQLREKIREEINRKPPFTPKDLAVNGHDIMALGVPEGPAIGRVQKFLMDKVLDDPALNDKEILEKLIREHQNSFT